jgi:hypothetical protein
MAVRHVAFAQVQALYRHGHAAYDGRPPKWLGPRWSDGASDPKSMASGGRTRFRIRSRIACHEQPVGNPALARPIRCAEISAERWIRRGWPLPVDLRVPRCAPVPNLPQRAFRRYLDPAFCFRRFSPTNTIRSSCARVAHAVRSRARSTRRRTRQPVAGGRPRPPVFVVRQ